MDAKIIEELKPKNQNYATHKKDISNYINHSYGNRITELINKELIRGEYSISWNGTDNNNITIDSGIYFIFFNIKDLFRTIKVIKY